jgi:hypothetical protein
MKAAELATPMMPAVVLLVLFAIPAPWHADKMPGGYVVRDANGQAQRPASFHSHSSIRPAGW